MIPVARPFEEAVNALDDGELSEPVHSAFGVHLILRTDKVNRIPEDLVVPLAAEGSDTVE